MSHFAKIKAALDVTERTAEFDLHELKATLTVRAASMENKLLFNASMRLNGNTPKGKKLTEAEQLEQGLREMRELWPGFVITGWRGIVSDETGEPLTYTPQLGRELLEALPLHILLRLKAFASDMDNFVDTDGLPQVNVEAVAGN